MAGNRSHAFIRGLYANAQNQHTFTSLVRRSGREAVASAERGDNQSKRKRTDEENVETTAIPFDQAPQQSLFSAGAELASFESELYSCLFDRNNRCTIFDVDEPGTAMNIPTMEMKRFKLSPSRMNVSSESPTLVSVNVTPTPPEVTNFAPLPMGKVLITHGENAENRAEPALFESELYSLFEQTNPRIFLDDEPGTAVNVPTMEMKHCKLSPSSINVSTESPALVQVNVTPTPPEMTTFEPLPMERACDTVAGTSSRNRPFKNVRERRRRAQMRNKFMQLYNLCCSKVVTSVVATPSAEATGLLIPISGHGAAHTLVNEPSKVEVLVEAIQAFEALDKELTDLRARNSQLKAEKLLKMSKQS